MRVEFSFGAINRFRSACQILQKHYLQNIQFLVYTKNQRALAHFNRLLWGFKPTAFIPHALYDDPLVQHAPIILCQNESQLTQAQQWLGQPWLLNLDDRIPPITFSIEQILEVVSTQESCRQNARLRWRNYQAKGFSIQARELEQPSPI